MFKISKFYQIWIHIKISNLLIPDLREARHSCLWNLECSKNRIFTITLELIWIFSQFFYAQEIFLWQIYWKKKILEFFWILTNFCQGHFLKFLTSIFNFLTPTHYESCSKFVCRLTFRYSFTWACSFVNPRYFYFFSDSSLWFTNSL